MKPDSITRELFVTDISPEVDEEQLRKLFSVCGGVGNIHMVVDKRSGEFSGCAFVRMASLAEAKDALVSLDGARLVDRCITVKPARAKSNETTAPPPATEKRSRVSKPRGRRQQV